MRTAIVIMEGVTQIVLTPETGLDKQIVEGVCPRGSHGQGAALMAAHLMRGSFFETRGGWQRIGEPNSQDDSLIIRLAPPVQEARL